MIAISIIRLLEAAESEPIVDVAWRQGHPGDQIENSISQRIREHLDENISDIFVTQGKVIYLRWVPDSKLGISATLTSLDTDIYKIGIDTYEWILYSKFYAHSSFNSWEELFELYQYSFDDELVSEVPMNLTFDWFRTSLTGGEIRLELSETSLEIDLANIFGYFPWSLFFLETGRIDKEAITLVYTEHEVSDIPLTSIYEDEIEGELNETFWLLVYQLIIKLSYLNPEDRWPEFQQYFVAVFELTREGTSNIDKLEAFTRHQEILSQLSSDFVINQIRDLLFNLSTEKPSVELAMELLEFAEVLIGLEFTELAKLAEGTTLELILQVDNPEDQHVVIMELTRRTIRWGDNYIISYIQSLTGLLADTTLQKDILTQAVEIVEDHLKTSWEGVLCLVETYILADKTYRAIVLRFGATKKIGDKITQAEDIFTAVIWGLEYEISDTKFFELSEPYLRDAISILAHSETIVDHFDLLAQSCLEHNKALYLQLVIDLLRDNIAVVDPEIRQVLIERISSNIEVDEDTLGTFVYSKLLSFQLLMDQSHEITSPDTIDAAFKLIGTMYNTIDPHEDGAPELLLELTKKIIFSAMQTKNWNLIEEAIRRYVLLIGDQERTGMQEIFLEAARIRSELPKSQLTQNDIGLRFFDEACKIDDFAINIKMLDHLPRIKELAIKSQSFDALTRYLIMEIRLKKVHDIDWIDAMIRDLKVLLSKGEIRNCNKIFQEALNLDLTQEEEYTILNTQLQLTETEPDLMSSDEIYQKRMRMKLLINEDEVSYDEILENYRDGISELISKGDNRHLEELLIDAIEYTQEQAPEQTIEFQKILVDSYQDSIMDYTNNENQEAYYRCLRIFRKADTRFGMAQFSLVGEMIVNLVEANLELYEKTEKKQFLRKAALLLKEMALLPTDDEPSLSQEFRQQMVTALGRTMDYMQTKHPEFGPVEASQLGVLCYARWGLEEKIPSLIDETLSILKKSALRGQEDGSPLILALLLINQFYIYLDGDINPERFEMINQHAIRTCNFILSTPYANKSISSMIKDLRQKLQSTGHQAIQQFPFAIERYIREFDQAVSR